MDGGRAQSFPRRLTDGESALFGWCADRLSPPDGAALKEQLAECQVIDEDDGGLWFSVPLTAPAVARQGIDLTYDDVDGGRVAFIIAFVTGYLSWVDRYRADSAPLQRLIPAPAEVRSFRIAES